MIRRPGLGDVLQDAAAKFAAAGYPGAKCAVMSTKNVNNGVQFAPDLVQNECSVPGFAMGFSADDIAAANVSVDQLRAELSAMHPDASMPNGYFDRAAGYRDTTITQATGADGTQTAATTTTAAVSSKAWPWYIWAGMLAGAWFVLRGIE